MRRGQGRIYTDRQFAEAFENRGGLGGKHGHPRTARGAGDQGLHQVPSATRRDYGYRRSPGSHFGYLCVEGMEFGRGRGDGRSGNRRDRPELTPVLPSHYKCPQTGAVLAVENPAVWVYPERAEDDLTHMSEA